MSTPILELRQISKSFPGVQALAGVDFDLPHGEVHALVGENGAGKSTLIKIIAGVYAPTSGEIVFNGRPVQILSPRQALEMGIAVIYQESNLYNELTVAENVFMGRQPKKGVLRNIDWDELFNRAQEVFNRIGVEMDVRTKVGGLSTANRQRVEVAKALSQDAKVLVMDEPTAALAKQDVDALFRTVKILRQNRVSIIYISHRLEEVFEIADRVTILRDGRRIDTKPLSEVTPEKLVTMMVGRTLDTLYPKESVVLGEPVLRVSHLTYKTVTKNVSFQLHHGEILGLAGLVGAGRSELAQVLFGIYPAENGEIYIGGKKVEIRSPMQAKSLGVAYVPEDRQRQGLIVPMTVRENISLAYLEHLTKFGFASYRDEEKIAADYVGRLQVRTPSLSQRVINLSGGNQQKIVVSKWLVTRPKVLILDEPTRGIDIGAKAEIHRLMSHLAQEGLGILMISSELPEILGMSDRILVMRKGVIAGEYSRAEATQEGIISTAMGLDQKEEKAMGTAEQAAEHD
jgi:rhamnose transport system ATP-binding protein